MIETFFEEAIEIVNDPEIGRMLGEYAEICKKNHGHVELETGGEHENAYDSDHSGEHAANL